MGRLWNWSSQRAGSLLIVVALVGGGAYAVEMHDIQKRQNCFAAYERTFAAQSKVRGDLNTASDDTKTKLLDGIADAFLTPPTTDKKEQAKRTAGFLKLLSDYRAASTKVGIDRAATPLPTLQGC